MTYGLAFVDEDGAFRDEAFRAEGDFTDGRADIFVIVPGDPPRVLLGPERPLFHDPSIDRIARRVVATESELILDGADADGAAYRLFAMPTYREGTDEPSAAILVLGDPRPAQRSHAAFVTGLTLTALGIGAVGILVGLALAQRSLRPLARALATHERFLVAAAHELRTPVASLRAVLESSAAGDEPADDALKRMGPLVRRTGDVVEELLIFARLDAGAATLQREAVRLDLLVETCLSPEAELVAEESVVSLDARLARVAVRNLVENALRHAGSDARPRVAVRGATVTVEDDGPGIPEAVLHVAAGPFTVAPSQRGAGIGLATAKMIAELHGGGLTAENRPEGGARVTLRLARQVPAG
ncbi:MAG: HAMP domain-containing sensor histidine kinase [Planctomycetota bacterium]